MCADAAGASHWNTVWSGLGKFELYPGPIIEQHPVLYRFLSKAGGGDAIEIGCVPGSFLVYLAKEYGYRVSGIDYSEFLDYTRENLHFNDIEPVDLIRADLFKYKSDRQYDLVFSSGFVEHFDDYRLVVQKHADLAKPNGLVVIIVPNLRYIHWLLGTLFQPKLMSVHRFPLMKSRVLTRTLTECGLEVLHCGYIKTFRPVYRLPKAMDFASRAVQKLLRISKLDNLGNRFASPYLISVSRKPA